jgi:hypothetical protein
MKIFSGPGGHDMRIAIIVLLVLWLGYAVLSFLAPPAASSSRYGLTLTQINLVRLTIVLPLLFIWLTSLYSVVHFHRYARIIKNSPEGSAFRKITTGLWMLLLVIILPSLVNAVANFYPNSQAAAQFSTVIRNYISVVFYLVGFWYLWQASLDFLRSVPGVEPSMRDRNYSLSGVAILVLLLTWFILHNPFRTESVDPVVRATYYLPDPLIFLTIVIPYGLIWALGALTIINFRTFTKHVSGLIYREIFSSVTLGITTTLLLLIGLQFLSQANAALGHATFSVILIIIYLLLLAIAVGYLLIARGARKLTVIEEVD